MLVATAAERERRSLMVVEFIDGKMLLCCSIIFQIQKVSRVYYFGLQQRQQDNALLLYSFRVFPSLEKAC